MQCQYFPDPIPRSIWGKIIQDQFYHNYSHQDDHKEFMGGYVLTKKDQVSAKKPVRSEAEWVSTPHNPSIAIQFDVEARDCYSRSPYHLNNRDMLHVPLLVQLFCSSNSNSKHESDPLFSSSSKRALVPCQNWSLGICDDPCLNRRKHGVCCECGGQHRAKEVQDKRRDGKESGVATSRNSARRT
ncbi:hypothetical protein BYT27DRAFT_7226908 [Phlegmacium glaucopus]|nr:hypothetical protein BYT27DRAFT_7226908 [Phlegmacium glaucopus]